MNFIVGLPLTARKYNLIWVIVDRLTESTHFIPVNTNYNIQKYAKIYIARVLCLHGVPILEKCGKVAYKLELPPSLAGVHDIFHVSQLNKCLKAPVDVVLPEVAPLETDLTYPEHPIKIFDQKGHITRRKTIKFYKVQHGKARILSILAIRILSCRSEGTFNCSLFLLNLFSFQILG
jgi:hypothetical protein